MKKHVSLLIVFLFSFVSIFASTPNTNSQNSNISLETHVGYSLNNLRIKMGNNIDGTFINLDNKSISIEEQLTINTDYLVNFTTSLAFNSDLNKRIEMFFHRNKVETTFANNIESIGFQNSLIFFLGAEIPFKIKDYFSANFSIGPDILFAFENQQDSPSSYYSYGFKGIANIGYIFSNNMNLNLGLSAYFNPFCGGDLIDSATDGMDLTAIDYLDYTYSITPNISFTYKI